MIRARVEVLWAFSGWSFVVTVSGTRTRNRGDSAHVARPPRSGLSLLRFRVWRDTSREWFFERKVEVVDSVHYQLPTLSREESKGFKARWKALIYYCGRITACTEHGPHALGFILSDLSSVS